MTTKDRKEIILARLSGCDQPISASAFAKELGVSRQIIVGDIALLRALGSDIVATPRGYILENSTSSKYTVACRHSKEQLLDELYTVVDCGCGFIDVIVEHGIYGQIVGNLHIFSRSDADNFMAKMEAHQTEPLCTITGDLHLHTLSCPSPEHFEAAKNKLRQKGYLVESF